MGALIAITSRENFQADDHKFLFFYKEIWKRRKSLPLPFGVITCTRSSTVTLFVPFFFIYALVSQKKFSNIETKH